MRLIDADEFEAALENTEYDISPAYEPDGYSHKLICEVLEETPTVDAVPVVRCKDCKYYKPDEFECGCDFAGGLPYVKADDFCSFGKRRDQSADVRKMDGGGADAP